MPKYAFEIRKADHPAADGTADVHVHVWYNEGQSRKLLGRYRLPGLDPIFPTKEPDLSKAEEDAVREFLTAPQTLKKLQEMAQSTVFDLAKVAAKMKPFAEVGAGEQDGEAYLIIKVPVSRRIR